ncbi:tetratricopeptide repeat protein [Kingella denitrificans]|uniref:tetratricopeptide repeat protein n=1 Tax=Kingella denitrificans TaxID=502 RepID=UPI0028D3BDBE|nr:tetratricopeptide repeat protein [Kingella denitrificans]
MLKKLAGLFRTNHSNDLENLQRHAEQGDAEAMYLLGRMYHIGELVEADDEKAMLLYRRANALGYPLAANSIGALYDNIGEPEKAVEWFEQGIRQGDKQAETNLGRFYLNGIAVAPDTAKGLSMLEPHAAQNGHAALTLGFWYDGDFDENPQPDNQKALEYYLLAEKNSQDLTTIELTDLYNNLGTLYNNHDGIPTDYPKAQKYFIKAAELGMPHAMLNLGHLYAGKGEHKQAFKWYLKAAENDLIDAYYYVGKAYAMGKGVPQDGRKAVAWLEQAAEYGVEEWVSELAYIYRNGLDGVPKDLAKAEALFALLAKQNAYYAPTLAQIRSQNAACSDWENLLVRAEGGELAAQKDLAMAYMRGEAVEEDAEASFKWYKAAAEQGDAEAQNSLYVRYAEGRGVAQNKEEALKWLHRAAEQEYGMAYYNLGWEYAYGGLLEKDEQKAIGFFKKAAEKSVLEAYAELGLIYTYGKTIPNDYALARRYYEQAGGSKLGQAQNELATLHYNGQGTPKDDSKAFLYYQFAASNDSPEGMYNLAMMYENGFGTKRNRKLADEWYKKAYEAGFEEA